MNEGYLSLETHPDRPGLVRLVSSDEDPRGHHEGSGNTRFVLKFQDIHAAFMHAHTAMRHSMVDLNNHLYKKSLAEAMGDLESIELRHEPIWKDPDLSSEELDVMEHEIEHRHEQQARRDRFVQIIKWVAIGLLVFNLLAPGISELLYG